MWSDREYPIDHEGQRRRAAHKARVQALAQRHLDKRSAARGIPGPARPTRRQLALAGLCLWPAKAINGVARLIAELVAPPTPEPFATSGRVSESRAWEYFIDPDRSPHDRAHAPSVRFIEPRPESKLDEDR